MSKAIDIALRRAKETKILTNDQVERLDKFTNDIKIVRTNCDKLNQRLYKARVYQRTNKLSKVQQDELDKISALQKDYIRQIKNIEMFITQITG